MRVDATDRALLALLEHDPLISFVAAAHELNTSPQTLARRYQRLREHHLVRVVGRTLPYFQGRVAWLLRAQVDPRHTVELAQILAQQPTTRWVRASRDLGELTCGLVTAPGRSDPILAGFPTNPAVMSFTPHELLRVWSAQGAQAVETSPIVLDDIDTELLRLLGTDGRMPTSALARALRQPISTVNRRRTQLERSGVLFYETDVDETALGQRVDAMLWIQVPPGHIRAAGERLRDAPGCRFVAAVSGSATIAANVVVADADALIDFVDAHLGGLGVTHLETILMGHAYKRSGL